MSPLGRASIPVESSDIKYSNRRQVISAFLELGECTAQDVADHCGLSRQTVTKSIRHYLDSCLLESLGKGVSTASGGKRPEMYAITSRRYFLCVSLWPQETRLVLYTIARVRVDTISIQAPLPASPEAAVENVMKLSDFLLQKYHLVRSDIVGVSLSTAGTVNQAAGTLVYNSQCPSWGRNVPLLDLFRPHFEPGTLLLMDNAGKMTARVPLMTNRALQDKRVIVFFTGWGVSACLMERGHILSGKNSLIGEIGHMIVFSGDHETCSCGGRGCVERMTSLDRIRYLVKEFGPDFPPSVLQNHLEDLTIPSFFDFSRAGDPLAQHISKGMAWVFATALRNTSLLFDPDLVIFQGDYSYADEVFTEYLFTELDKFLYLPSHSFSVEYDRSSLAELDADGSWLALAHRYYSSL